MYSHGPSYKTRPVNLPDPYETKFTAKTVNDTAQIRGRRGFGSILDLDAMVKRNYPDYVLAAKHISHYRDMKMVTFAVDQKAHSLIVTFPAFIKNYKQPPL